MTGRLDHGVRNQSLEEWMGDYNKEDTGYRAEAVTKQSRNVDSNFSDGTTSEEPAPTIKSVEYQKANTTPIVSDATTSKHDDQDDDLLPPPLVKPGQYVGVCTGRGLRSFREGEDKLFFKIDCWIENGQKVTLKRWYNVEKLSNPKQGAGFKVKGHSAYRREFIGLFPDAANIRLDRFYPDRLVKRKLQVKVRTVSQDMKHETISEGAQYSVIEKILSIEEDK